MKLSVVTIMELEGLEHRVLSHESIFKMENKEFFFNERICNKFLEPLLSEGFTGERIKDFVFAIKQEGYKFCESSYPATILLLKGAKSRVFLEKKDDIVDGFLLRELSSEELSSIRSKAVNTFSIEDKETKSSYLSKKKKRIKI